MNIQAEFNKMLNWEKASQNLSDYKESFKSAEPFEYIVLDDLFNEDYLRTMLEEFDAMDWSKQDVRNDEGIQVKLRSNWKDDNEVPPMANMFIHMLNSGNFLRFLSELTGIDGIISDPYLTGGGFNQINRDGHLAVHADGNWHDLMGVHRRLNAILYLNENWDEAWGGHFELWDHDLTHAVKKIAPLFNRMVIFKTDDFSYHGHPEPLACPEDRSRRSLILYYYTNTRPESELAADEKHRAVWKKSYLEK